MASSGLYASLHLIPDSHSSKVKPVAHLYSALSMSLFGQAAVPHAGLWFSRLESWSGDISRPSFQTLDLELGLECLSLGLGVGLETFDLGLGLEEATCTAKQGFLLAS